MCLRQRSKTQPLKSKGSFLPGTWHPSIRKTQHAGKERRRLCFDAGPVSRYGQAGSQLCKNTVDNNIMYNVLDFVFICAEFNCETSMLLSSAVKQKKDKQILL